MKNSIKLIPAALLAAIAPLAMAAPSTVSDTLTVKATVGSTCAVKTNEVNFGTYDPAATAANQAAGSLEITCTLGNVPSVYMDLGQNTSASKRRMKASKTADYLTYELYQPVDNKPGSACNYTAPVVWKSTSADKFTLSASKSSTTADKYNVCGQIVAGLSVPADNYSDAVVVTVEY